jgi:uncharacterized membrane protein
LVTPFTDRRRTVAIAIGYGAGIVALPWLPGPYLQPHPGLTLRLALAFLLPTVAMVVAWSTVSAFGAINGRAAEASGAALRTIIYVVTCFIVTLHVIVILTLIGVPFSPIAPARLVLSLTGLLLVLVGNWLPRSRPNLALGIRTQQLLTNAHAWARVHRFVGHVTVGVGLVTVWAALALRGSELEPLLATTIVAAVTTVALAYRAASRA